MDNNDVDYCNMDIEQVVKISKLKQLVLQYRNYGHSEIDEFIEIFNSDDELKQLKFTSETIKVQQIMAKKRLFVIYCNGSFGTIHNTLFNHFSKLFKYEW